MDEISAHYIRGSKKNDFWQINSDTSHLRKENIRRVNLWISFITIKIIKVQYLYLDLWPVKVTGKYGTDGTLIISSPNRDRPEIKSLKARGKRPRTPNSPCTYLRVSTHNKKWLTDTTPQLSVGNNHMGALVSYIHLPRREGVGRCFSVHRVSCSFGSIYNKYNIGFKMFTRVRARQKGPTVLWG